MKIGREIAKEVASYLGSGKVLVLKGARQVGKTTIMLHLKAQLDEKGEETFYISADEDFGLGSRLSKHH